jgi:hypothetical protein
MTKSFTLFNTAVIALVLQLSFGQTAIGAQPSEDKKNGQGLLIPSSKETFEQWGISIDDAQYERALDEYVQRLPNVIDQTQRLMALYDKALAFAASESERKGEFSKGVYDDANLGQAKILSVDGSLVVSIVEPMKNEVLFVHSSSLPKDSQELQSYIKQQNSVAELEGRHLIVVWRNDRDVDSTQVFHKPKKWSFRYWQGYIAAVHKPATFDSVCFGLLSGLAQATLTGILGAIQSGFTPHVAILSMSVFGFGSFIGTFSATYRNVVFYSHSKLSQILKQSVVSFAFAYMIFSLNQMALGDASHLTTLSEFFGLILNIFFSTTAKNEFSQWARIKDLGKADMKEYSVDIPLTNKSFKFSEKDVNYQLKVQLTTQAIRTADLLGYHLNIPLATGFYKVEIGKLLLWLSAPVVNIAVKRWAMKNYPDTARAMGLDKSFKQSISDFFKGLLSSFRGMPRAVKDYPRETAVNSELEVVNETYLEALSNNLSRQQWTVESEPSVRCQKALKAASE